MPFQRDCGCTRGESCSECDANVKAIYQQERVDRDALYKELREENQRLRAERRALLDSTRQQAEEIERLKEMLRNETVLCSLRDPDWVSHLERTDCPHPGPHHMAVCGAFKTTRG